MNTVMVSSDSEQLNTDSDESDISEVESLQETIQDLFPWWPKIVEKRQIRKK